MIINFIRHGKTAGNIERRFIGSTNEPLCDAGIAELKNIVYPECERVISSPMTRCIETANIIYPSENISAYDELRECDFGIFEGKRHAEMDGDPTYIKWIENNGMTAPPGGENVDEFRERCAAGFLKAVGENRSLNAVSFVVHGGTIMSILEKYAVPHKEFYEYVTENGRGWLTVFDGEKLRITGKI